MLDNAIGAFVNDMLDTLYKVSQPGEQIAGFEMTPCNVGLDED